MGVPPPKVGVPPPTTTHFANTVKNECINDTLPGRAKTHYDSPDANNLAREVLVTAAVVRSATGQEHEPSGASGAGNGRARPEITIHIVFRHPVGVSGSISRRYGANAVGVSFLEFFLSRQPPAGLAVIIETLTSGHCPPPRRRRLNLTPPKACDLILHGAAPRAARTTSSTCTCSGHVLPDVIVVSA